MNDKTQYLTIEPGEAEETKRGMLKSAGKKFLNEQIAKSIAESYTIVLKGTNAYIRFLRLNEVEKKQTTKKPKLETNN